MKFFMTSTLNFYNILYGAQLARVLLASFAMGAN